MNYEEIESMLDQAEAENNKGHFVEAEQLCELAIEKVLKIAAHAGGKSDANPRSKSDEDFKRIATLHSRALNGISESLGRRGITSKAILHADEALHLSIQAQNKEQEAKALNNNGMAHKNLSDYPRALEYYNKALSIFEELGNKFGAAGVHVSIGNVYSFLTDYTSALEYLTKALAVYQEIGNKNGIAIANGNIGLVYYHRCEYPQALEYYSTAVAMYQEVGNKNGIAASTGNIGEAYRHLADYTRALEYYSSALAIYEKMGNKAGIAANTGNIGIVYWHLADYTRALQYFTKALAINEELGNIYGLAANTGNIGEAHWHLADYTSALEYYSKALALYQEIGKKDGVAVNTASIGNMYTYLYDYPRALEYYSKALAIYQEISNKAGVATTITNIGKLYGKKDYEDYDTQKAEDFLLKAIAMYEEIGVKNFEVHKILAEIYENVSRWKEAHENFKKYCEIEKEVLSDEAKKQGELMEYRRKLEESERDRQVKLARFEEQEKILLNILPAQIAERILEGEKRIADLHEHVSVFFSDIVGFTKLSQTISPDELLTMLNEIFSEFDRIARKHGLEKIKTIGDAYMAVAGVPLDQEDHAERAAAFALDVIEYMKRYRKTSKSDLQIRVGLHTGRAIAGVIGENKFAYDLWGDSVNTASRMESHGEAGKIHVSEDFRSALKNSTYQFIDRGEMEVKGKGMMTTYFIEPARP
jgi:class 3 adenylate cyclase